MKDHPFASSIILALWLAIPLGGFAQTTLRGLVLDENRQPLQLCNVLALTADSALVTGGITDAKGAYSVSISDSTALVRFVYVGYQEQTLPVGQIPPEVVLLPADVEIGQASVQGTRPQLKMKDGLVELPVLGTSLTSRGSITDLLRQLPGFVGSGDDGVRMVNGGAFLIYLNGHKIRSFDEIRQLDPTTVKSLKLNTAPGAKYSSEVAAVIFIETKARLQGLSTYARARLQVNNRLSHSENIRLSYTPGKMSYYGELGYSDERTTEEKVFDMAFTQGAQAAAQATLHTVQAEYDRYAEPRAVLGIESQPSDRLGFGGRYSFSHEWSYGDSQEHHSAHRYGALADTVENSGSGHAREPRHQLTAYGRYRFTDNLEFTLDADFYLHTQNRTVSNQERSLLTGVQQTFTMQKATRHQLWQLTPVFEYSFGDLGTLELGGEVNQITGGGLQAENGVTTQDYANRERLVAGFASYSLRLGEWSAEIGARYEYAASDVINHLASSKTVHRHYSNPFANAKLSGAIGPTNHILSFTSYTRRPSLWLLNGADVRSSAYLRQESNPYLRPTLYYRASYNIVWSGFYLELKYTYGRGVISYTFRPNPDVPNGYIVGSDNFPSSHDFQVTASLNLPITAWYTLDLTGMFGYNLLDVRKYSGQMRHLPMLFAKVDNQFTLPYDFYLSVEGQYTSRRMVQIFAVSSGYEAAVYLSKWFMKRTLQLSLRANDILASAGNTYLADLNGLRFGFSEWLYTRYLSFRVAWKFNRVKEYNGREAAEEAIGRM